MKSHFFPFRLFFSLSVVILFSLANNLFSKEQWNLLLLPGIGGAMQAIAPHPTNPDILFAGVDMGALFRSDDGGKNWTLLGTGKNNENPGLGGGFSIAVDPSNPETVWSASGEIYKSTDGGKKWNMMNRSPEFAGIHYHKIAVDPLDGMRVYAVTHDRFCPNGHILKTTDGGKSWRKIFPDPKKKTALLSIAVSPSVRGLVFAGSSHGLLLSRDGGEHWTRHPEIPDLPVRSIHFSKGRIYLNQDTLRTPSGGVKGGIRSSGAEGIHWTKLDGEILEIVQKNSPAGKPTAWILETDRDGRIYYARLHGGFQIYQSEPGGRKWKRIYAPKTLWIKDPVPAELAAYQPPKPGHVSYFHIGKQEKNIQIRMSAWVPGMNGLAVSPVDPKRIWLSNNASVYGSRDGGKSWECGGCRLGDPLPRQQWNREKVAPSDHTHALLPGGLALTVPQQTAFNPFRPNEVACAFHDIGLRISRDNGKSTQWSYDRSSMLRVDSCNSNAVVYDPHHPGVMYYGASDLFRSEDHGLSWKRVHVRPVWKELDDFRKKGGSCRSTIRIWKVRLDPFDKTGKTLLVSATADGGYSSSFDRKSSYRVGKLCRTEDGGKTWQTLQNGLPSPLRAEEILFDPNRRDLLWAGLNRSGCDGLYRSDDGGKNWTRIAPELLGAVREDCIAPVKGNPNVIYVNAYAPGKNGFWSDSTLYRSDDGGKTWRALRKGFISSVAVAPDQPDRVYIAIPRGLKHSDREAGIFRSTDGGKTWTQIGQELPMIKSRIRLQWDSVQKNRLIVNTPIGTWVATGI